MIGYPTGDSDRRIAPEVLGEVVTSVFRRCDMSAGDAALLAETLVHADLRGVHSHGVLRLGDYVKKLRIGGVDREGLL